MRFLCGILLAFVLAFALFSKPTLDTPTGPAFTSVPELEAGYRLLYQQKFNEARQTFEKWTRQHPSEPFGQASLAATYLFEEFYLQHVLTSDYFLDDKRFLGGITGTPDPTRMKNFEDACGRARALADQRLSNHPRDSEGLFVLVLCAGMQSDVDSMLMKRQYDALKQLKEANTQAEILLHDYPQAYDAYVAPGIAYYVIGSLSPTARFMLWFGGIHGDKELGMSEVQKTADYGRYLKPYAQILLALAARREKKDAIAQKNLKALTEEFPGNAVYDTEYAKAMGLPLPASVRPVN